jgi:hypothetical protein
LRRSFLSSESNDVFAGCQPQYPDLQGYFNIDIIGVQAVFVTTRHLPVLTRHAPAAYSVIEEIVEGFFGLRQNVVGSVMSIFLKEFGRCAGLQKG